MARIKNCINEWNATLEALGQGKQTILIRKYSTNLNDFLLNPTGNYVNQDNYLQSFQKKYVPFVEENSLPNKDDKKTEIKYYAKIEKIIEKPSNRVDNLSDYHIWTNKHVKSYLGSKNAKIWILRVYKLKKPVMAENGGGQKFVNLTKTVSLDSIEPVLSDSEFGVIVQEIESKK